MSILQSHSILLKRYYGKSEATKIAFMFNLKVGMSLLSCESDKLQSFKAEIAETTKTAIAPSNVQQTKPVNHNDNCEVETQFIESLVR